MTKTEFIEELKKLDIPRQEFVILSGGSMLMRGLREQTSDLDITVSKRYAQEIDLYKYPRDDHGLYMPFENVQMMDDMDQFEYDLIDGFQCESLKDIMRMKRIWNRPKDQKDMQVIAKRQYADMTAQGKALTDGIPHLIANLANLSALVYQTLDTINWAGFYLADGNKLVLGPFQGRPACIEISFGKGVCGTAAQEDRTILVEDVHKYKGHIACDSASRSEIVVPVHISGKLAGVLDIDSPVEGRFTETDLQGLETFVKEIFGK